MTKRSEAEDRRICEASGRPVGDGDRPYADESEGDSEYLRLEGVGDRCSPAPAPPPPPGKTLEGKASRDCFRELSMMRSAAAESEGSSA